MLVRQANAQDIPAIMQLANSSPAVAHWSRQQYEGVFAPSATRRAVWVVEDEEKGTALQGFLVAREVAGEWEIENVVVEEGARRQRLGSHLLLQLQDVARTEQASAIFLEVRESNHAARAFYESRGFEQTGRRSRYYSIPDEDAITYRLQLA